MHSSSGLLAVAAAISTASAATFGFNHGAQYQDQSAKTEADFAAEFRAGQNLPGTNGRFTSARLFTMLQHGSTTEVIQAIPAAIDTNTRLLLGLWCSAGPEVVAQEIAALQRAVEQYPDMVDLIDGISVGSEDMYRVSEIGLRAPDAAPGAGPDTIADYIGQVRDAIQGGPLAGIPIGHVDTWTAWANESNSAVAAAVDFVGTDAYPYFQNTMSNSIDEAYGLFQEALAETRRYAGDAEVWVTETGWPVSGDDSNLAVAGTTEARTYWEQVACRLLNDDDINTWWYILQDAAPTTPSPSFGILTDLSGEPLYDLSCEGVDLSTPDNNSTSTSEGSSTATATRTGTGNQASSTGSSDDEETTSGTPAVPTGTGSGGSTGGSVNETVPNQPTPSGTSGGSGSGSSASDIPVGAAAVSGAPIAVVLAAAFAAMLL